MPRLNGVGLAQALRAARPDLPVVMLTGNPPRSGLPGFTLIGPSIRVLTKPADVTVLMLALEEAVTGRLQARRDSPGRSLSSRPGLSALAG